MLLLNFNISQSKLLVQDPTLESLAFFLKATVIHLSGGAGGEMEKKNSKLVWFIHEIISIEFVLLKIWSNSL